MMAIWTCDRMKSVEAERANEAAAIFADRLARRYWGKAGTCAALRESLRTQNGNWFLFEAFIGRRLHDGSVSGRNCQLELHRQNEEAA